MTRSCARCGASIDGYRPQAIYCGGPCRAAASRKRAAEKSENDQPGSGLPAADQTARNRTGRAAAVVEWESLPADERQRIERLLARHADLLEAAS